VDAGLGVHEGCFGGCPGRFGVNRSKSVLRPNRENPGYDEVAAQKGKKESGARDHAKAGAKATQSINTEYGMRSKSGQYEYGNCAAATIYVRPDSCLTLHPVMVDCVSGQEKIDLINLGRLW